jgi:hypothetical protein
MSVEWHNSSYANRVKFTIDGNKIEGDLTDFPVAIQLSDSAGIGGADLSSVIEDSATTSGGVDSYTKLLLHGTGDVSGTATLTFFNEIDASPNGKFDKALYFDGGDHYVTTNTATDLSLGASDFTIEFWAKIPASQPSSQARIVGGNYTSSWGSNCWSLHSTHTAVNRWSFWVYNLNASSPVLVSSSASNTNVWTHVAITRSGSDWRMFIDGVLEDTYSSATSLDNGIATFQRLSAASVSSRLKGYISEYRTSKGIARYTTSFSGSLPSGPFESDSYDILHIRPDGDSSSSEHQYAFGNVVMPAANRKFDNAYYFTNDLISIPTSSDFDFGTSAFTIDFWVRFDSIPGNDYQIITARRQNSASRFLIYLDGRDSEGSNQGIRFGITTGSWFSLNAKNISDLSAHTWYHIAVAREGNGWYLFVDGNLKDYAVDSRAWPNWTLDWRIGGEPLEGKYLTGYLSEYRISKGIARWTKDFTPPNQIYDDTWEELVNDNRKKIAIYHNDTDQCYVEIEDWNWHNNTAALWTKIPTLTSGTDKDLYLYYNGTSDNTTYVGDPGDTAAETVWDSNFKAVLHLSEPASGQSDEYVDSTGNVNDGVSAYSTHPKIIEDGVGFAQEFPSSANQFINLTNTDSVTGSNDYTYSVIIRPSDVSDSNYHYMVSKGTDSTRRARILIKNNSSSHLRISHYGVATNTNLEMVNDTLYHISVTYDAPYERVIVNGTEVLNYDFGTLNVSDSMTRLGARYGTATGYYRGVMDEYRESSVVRSDAWINADYYTSFDNFITFDTSLEPQPTHYYHGYVYVQASPVIRTVRLYNRATGQLVATATSDSSGYYYLTTLDNEEHYIVVLDDDAGEEYNALINDKLLPIGIV